VRFEVETAIDPLTADNGRPITGTWDMFVLLDMLGHLVVRRVAAGDNIGIALAPRRLKRTDLVAKPVLTSFGNLSLKVRKEPNGGPGHAQAASPLARTVRGGARRARALSRRALHALPQHMLGLLPARAQTAAKRAPRRKQR
jgi:hypothetical protein